MSALEKIKEEVAKIMQGNNHWIDRKHFNEDMQQSPATELFWKEVINRYASESVKEYKEKLAVHFEKLKSKAPTLRDAIYIDGILAVIDSFDKQ
jgi:hypothetical protein